MIGGRHENATDHFHGTQLAFAQFAGAIAETQQVSDPRVADLVRAGKVRVALYLPQYAKDPVTGELRGWPIDIVRALGDRLGIEGVPVEHPTPPAAIACLKSGACDVSIMGIDPVRATEVDYSLPFIQVDFTYLVPARLRDPQLRRRGQAWSSNRGRAQSCIKR